MRIVVVAKAPDPGRVKTRLAVAVGAERAAALAGAFLDDVL
ncbi:MAG: glycosyltransferase, partial [Deltaproteobacteria bacterium]|nr:glycosyltransferase [Deltaproteobacteria bacterium]